VGLEPDGFPLFRFPSDGIMGPLFPEPDVEGAPLPDSDAGGVPLPSPEPAGIVSPPLPSILWRYNGETPRNITVLGGEQYIMYYNKPKVI